MKTNKYRILVSEPWDYDGAEGQNLIVGKIIKELSPNCIVFESESELVFDNNKGKKLVLKSRHNDNIKNEKGEYQGAVNGGLILSDIMSNQVNAIENESKFVIIGTLEKLK